MFSQRVHNLTPQPPSRPSPALSAELLAGRGRGKGEQEYEEKIFPLQLPLPSEGRGPGG